MARTDYYDYITGDCKQTFPALVQGGPREDIVDAASLANGREVIFRGGAAAGIADFRAKPPAIGETVALDSSGSGFAITVENIACFSAGTLIETADGGIAVEDLRLGDKVRTLSGELKPIRWIGRRLIDFERQPELESYRPIRIDAGAFADGLPARMLFLSPDHAVWLEGALIPIGELVNRGSIRQARVASTLYYHIELDQHDVVFANGLAAETYRDVGDGAFASSMPAAPNV